MANGYRNQAKAALAAAAILLHLTTGCGKPSIEKLLAEGEKHFNAKDYNAAYAAYKEVVERDAENAQAFQRLAECCLWLRDADRGLYWIKRALQLNPTSATAWEKKGELLLAAQKPQEALVALEKALSLDGQMNLARLNMAVAYEAMGQADVAASVAKEAVQLEPKAAEPHFRYAAALQRAKRLAEAEAEYRRALAIDNSHVGALMALAQLLIKQKRKLEEARQLAQRANQLAPGNGEAAVLAAWALYLTGDKASAARELETVTRAHPTNLEAWILLTKMLDDLGQKDAARRAAAFAMQMAPRGAGTIRSPGRPSADAPAYR
jgi:protein O-GlcNAc transferase